MKRFMLPLIALALVGGACSAIAESTGELSLESLGTRRTAWGVLPTYQVSGQHFSFTRLPRPSIATLAIRPVTVDVLVNAEGAVQDATITSSSGSPAADLAVLASFIGARYSLHPGDNYPTPFVVQHRTSFRRNTAMRNPMYLSSWAAAQRSLTPAGSPVTRGPGGSRRQ